MSQVKHPWKSLIRMGFHDPAGRKPKSGEIKYSRARAAWVMIGQDSMGRVFVLDCLGGKFDPTTMQDKTFKMCEEWDPLVFGIEDNAMQSLYSDLTLQRARAEKRRVPIQGITQPTNVDKDFRIRQALRPLASTGKLFIPPRFVELWQEMQTFPSSPRKDLVDALASAVMMLPPPVPVHAIENERSERVAYLREAGADPRYIEQVARGLA